MNFVLVYVLRTTSVDMYSTSYAREALSVLDGPVGATALEMFDA